MGFGSVYYWPFYGGGPDVVLILCSSVVNTTRRFMLGLALVYVCVSSVLLAFWSPCVGKRELVFVLVVHLVVSYAHVNLCHCFSSSWCQGLAATSACGSSLTFRFPFLRPIKIISLFWAELIVRWAKKWDPWETTPDRPQVELGLSHIWPELVYK